MERQLKAFFASDVKEVVRCKDCIHNTANMERDPLDATDYNDITCTYFMTDGMELYDYCSRGKRKFDGKQGEWVPLGHRTGFGKNPFSEDFKCSLCGYEAYTLLSEPPATCPRCGANMEV